MSGNGRMGTAREALRRRLPRSLWKMVVSVMTFAVTFSVTNLLVRQNTLMWSTCVGLFVAGISFVAQFLFDVEEALNEGRAAQVRTERVTTELIGDRFRQVGESTAFYADAQRTVVGMNAVTDVVHGLVEVAEAAPLARALITAEFERLRRLTKVLTEGSYAIYNGEDREWLLTLAGQRLRSVDSVSIVSIEGRNQLIVDGGPWRSDRARRYFDAQAEALEPPSDTVVRRVFVVRDEKIAQISEFLDLCAEQEAVGMRIQVLDLSTPIGRQYQTLPEFILFNNEVSYEPSPAVRTAHGERPVLVSTRLDFDPERIAKLSRLFERLWQALA
jgi:hypothetical protein